MCDLQAICNTLLNNADLVLSVDGGRGLVTLEFYPSSNVDGNITFYCSEYSVLKHEKVSDESDGVFVGETHVTIIEAKNEILSLLNEHGGHYYEESLKPVALIKIDGGCTLLLICEMFSWQQGDGPMNKVL